jgi:hypothetical protein
VKPRRHKGDTKTFEELNFQEQAQAMNMTALQFRKQLAAHLRRANEEGRSPSEVLRSRLQLLERILAEYLVRPDVKTGAAMAETAPK